MTNFMGIRTKPYRVQSERTGESISLLAENKACALYTGAELLDEEVQNLSVFLEEEWQ